MKKESEDALSFLVYDSIGIYKIIITHI